jgi:hypothetical protein
MPNGLLSVNYTALDMASETVNNLDFLLARVVGLSNQEKRSPPHLIKQNRLELSKTQETSRDCKMTKFCHFFACQSRVFGLSNQSLSSRPIIANPKRSPPHLIKQNRLKPI